VTLATKVFTSYRANNPQWVFEKWEIGP